MRSTLCSLIRVPKHLRPAFASLVVLLASLNVAGQEQPANNHAGTLSDLADKQRALLVVFKSRVVDINNDDRAIINDVLKGDRLPRGRYAWVYNELAVKLNKYMNKHGSMLAARNLADAEYVIFFNVVEFRRIINAIYAYGELFVIVKGSPKDLKPPRIVWRAKKVRIASDAMRDLIKDLKTFRGEG